MNTSIVFLLNKNLLNFRKTYLTGYSTWENRAHISILWVFWSVFLRHKVLSTLTCQDFVPSSFLRCDSPNTSSLFVLHAFSVPSSRVTILDVLSRLNKERFLLTDCIPVFNFRLGLAFVPCTLRAISGHDRELQARKKSDVILKPSSTL